MTLRPITGSLVVLDACCVINLYATDRIEEILTHLPYSFAIPALVADEEILQIREPEDADGASERKTISPRRLQESELVEILEISTRTEQADFARFALDLDDGEAAACALAVAYEGSVATDDRKALRVLEKAVLQKTGLRVPTIQTPELLFEWAQLADTPPAKIRDVLHAVKVRGRFYPRRKSPHFLWWDGFFR